MKQNDIQLFDDNSLKSANGQILTKSKMNNLNEKDAINQRKSS